MSAFLNAEFQTKEMSGTVRHYCSLQSDIYDHLTSAIWIVLTQNVLALSTSSTVHMTVNLLKPTGYAIHQQFNSQQLYVLPTLYLCVLYLSENKQRLVPRTA